MRRTGAESTVGQKHAATTKANYPIRLPWSTPVRPTIILSYTPHLRLGQTRNRKQGVPRYIVASVWCRPVPISYYPATQGLCLSANHSLTTLQQPYTPDHTMCRWRARYYSGYIAPVYYECRLVVILGSIYKYHMGCSIQPDFLGCQCNHSHLAHNLGLPLIRRTGLSAPPVPPEGFPVIFLYHNSLFLSSLKALSMLIAALVRFSPVFFRWRNLQRTFLPGSAPDIW